MLKHLIVGLLAITLAGCGASTTPTVAPTTVQTIATAEQNLLLADQALIKIANIVAAAPSTSAALKAQMATLTNGSTGSLDIAASSLALLIQGTQPTGTTPQSVLGVLNGAITALEPVVAAVNPTAGIIMVSVQVLAQTAQQIISPTVGAKMGSVDPETAKMRVLMFVATN